MITFSGQVAWHRPHCTQASSAKRSIGFSGSSDSAPVGQAETQDRHSVQPSTLTSTVPNGAPCGSATMSTGAGRRRVQLAQRKPHHVALAADGGRRSRAWPRRPSARWRARRCRARPDRRSRWLRRARRQSRGRRGSARPARWSCARPAISWRGLARTRKRTARRAVGERRCDRFQSDLRHFVDLRPAARSPAGRRRAAPARRSIRRRARRRGTAPPPACRRPRGRRASSVRNLRSSASDGGSA